MFRPLFRRWNTIQVPKENGRINLQKVEVSRGQPRIRITQTIVQVFLFYCAYQTAVVLIYGPDPATTKKVEEIREKNQKKIEEFRKELQRKKDNPKPSDHGKEQHEAFSRSKALGEGESKEKQTTEKDDKIVKQLAPKDGSTIKPLSHNDGNLTIPIPGWIKELPLKTYEVSSPEQKAFRTFLRDENAIRRLYKAIDTAIINQMKTTRSHLSSLSLIDYTGSNSRDMNIATMVFHPPTYAIRCIVMKPNGDINLEWREMQTGDGTRAERTLHPVIMSKAFLAGIWGFSTTTAAVVQAKILDAIYPVTDYYITYKYVEVKQRKLLRQTTLARNPTYEEQLISKLPSSSYSTSTAQKQFPFLKGELEKDSNKELVRSQIQSITHKHALQHAVDMFKRSWVQGQLKAQRSTAAGAVHIIGNYTFVGKNGRYRIEVTAYYLPSDDALIGTPLITRGYMLSDDVVSEKMKNLNLAKVARPPQTPLGQEKPHSPVGSEDPKSKLKPGSKTEDPPRSEATPETQSKDTPPQKEAEKKAKE